MERELLILADLGHLKAYQVSRPMPEEQGTPRIELLKSMDTLELHGKLSDRVSDAAGRFASQDSGQGTMRTGTGERHEMKEEAERRLIKIIAGNMESVLHNGKGYASWHFAAHESVNHKILNCLPVAAQKGLRKNIKADLIKLGKAELVERFALAEGA